MRGSGYEVSPDDRARPCSLLLLPSPSSFLHLPQECLSLESQLRELQQQSGSPSPSSRPPASHPAGALPSSSALPTAPGTNTSISSAVALERVAAELREAVDALHLSRQEALQARAQNEALADALR
jgi:hypothetical protein